jgi:hypothetical protein
MSSAKFIDESMERDGSEIDIEKISYANED